MKIEDFFPLRLRIWKNAQYSWARFIAFRQNINKRKVEEENCAPQNFYIVFFQIMKYPKVCKLAKMLYFPNLIPQKTVSEKSRRFCNSLRISEEMSVKNEIRPNQDLNGTLQSFRLLWNASILTELPSWWNMQVRLFSLELRESLRFWQFDGVWILIFVKF